MLRIRGEAGYLLYVQKFIYSYSNKQNHKETKFSKFAHQKCLDELSPSSRSYEFAIKQDRKLSEILEGSLTMKKNETAHL